MIFPCLHLVSGYDNAAICFCRNFSGATEISGPAEPFANTVRRVSVRSYNTPKRQRRALTGFRFLHTAFWLAFFFLRKRAFSSPSVWAFRFSFVPALGTDTHRPERIRQNGFDTPWSIHNTCARRVL